MNRYLSGASLCNTLRAPIGTINPLTRQRIKAYLEVFIENLVQKYKDRQPRLSDSPEDYLAQTSNEARLKPFHWAIIPSEIILISAFERGFSTALGTTFEECARLIAQDYHHEAMRSYDIDAFISRSALNEIRHQITYFERHIKDTHKPTLEDMIQAVLAARRIDDLEQHIRRADVRILSAAGTEYLFEIKSPQPNKGQCLEVVERLLYFHLLRGQSRPAVQAYYAMAYNPYGNERDLYKRTLTLSYIPPGGLLIGHEFWDIVGGESAYNEVLDIYYEVGREKRKYMLDTLGYGF